MLRKQQGGQTTCTSYWDEQITHAQTCMQICIVESSLPLQLLPISKSIFIMLPNIHWKANAKRLWQEASLKHHWNHPKTTCMFLTHFTSPTPPVKCAEIMTHSFTDRWLAQGRNMFTRICASSWLFLEKSVPHISCLLPKQQSHSSEGISSSCSYRQT